MASDDNYLPYLVVAIKSISMHSSDEYVYDVRVLNRAIKSTDINAELDDFKPDFLRFYITISFFVFLFGIVLQLF